MLGNNGGLVGRVRLPTGINSRPGVWLLREQELKVRDRFWPGTRSDIEYTILNNGGEFQIRDRDTVNYVVDWGDETSPENITTNNKSHTYSAIGYYRVKLTTTGSYRPYYNNNSNASQITAVIFDTTAGLGGDISFMFYGASNMTTFICPTVATSGVTKLNNSWHTCSSLTSFPLIDTSSTTQMSGTWRNCSSLTSFPLIDTSRGTNFNSTWIDCTGLTSFPLIDTSRGTNFLNTWRNCTGLTSFPTIDTSSGTNFETTWTGCTGLTSFPLIDTSSGIDFRSTWSGCASLTSFPPIDTSNVTNFQSTWYQCTSLTSFPAINTSNGTNFTSTWFSIKNYTTFPSLNFSSATTFSSAWQYSDYLSTYPANQFDFTGTLVSDAFSNAFTGCALTAQSIENILTSLDTNGATNVTLGINFGTNAAYSSWSTAAQIALTNLTNKGWTVTYNT